MLELVKPLRILEWHSDMDDLVRAYLAGGAFSPALRADAQHVAAAAVSGLTIIISWNFQHLVNRMRRIRVNLVNVQQGYGQVEIIAPPEMG